MKKNLTGAGAVDGRLDHLYRVVGRDLERRVGMARLEMAIAEVRGSWDRNGDHGGWAGL